MRNLNIFLTLSFVILSRIYLFAGEGMWIPMLLQQMNEKEMKEIVSALHSLDRKILTSATHKEEVPGFLEFNNTIT